MAARIEYSEKYQDDSFEYRCEASAGCIYLSLAWASVASYQNAICVRKAPKLQPTEFSSIFGCGRKSRFIFHLVCE